MSEAFERWLALRSRAPFACGYCNEIVYELDGVRLDYGTADAHQCVGADAEETAMQGAQQVTKEVRVSRSGEMPA